MRPVMALVTVLAFTLLMEPARAHGDLAVNELETLAIRDFEGQEDSFAWEGFEIWDVYVGEGYNDSYDSDGVYFKVNFAGDGTQRPTGGQAWTITFRFNVGEEAIEKQITHDGTSVTTDFESLQWMIADGNVFQVKAWVPVADWSGKSVTDLVIVSAVDGEPRDTAPGGVNAPGSGAEVPVEGPATPIFPALGEGRIVDEVVLTGPAKFLNVTLAPRESGTFDLMVANPLREQGQHVLLRPASTSGWEINTTTWSANLDGGASSTFTVRLLPNAVAGSLVEPLRLDLFSDIGGRQTFYAYLESDDVALVGDPSLARAATAGTQERETPAPALAGLVGAMVLAIALRRARMEH